MSKPQAVWFGAKRSSTKWHTCVLFCAFVQIAAKPRVGLHVGAIEIPSDECANRKAMSQIVNAGTPAFAVLNAGYFEQGMDSVADARAGVGTKTALGIDEKRCDRILAERWGETLLKISPQFAVRVER